MVRLEHSQIAHRPFMRYDIANDVCLQPRRRILIPALSSFLATVLLSSRLTSSGTLPATHSPNRTANSNDSNSFGTSAIDTDDFYELVTSGGLLVDKSLLIEEYIKAGKEIILITRPKGWGKTLNMKMLQRFLEIEVDEAGEPLPKEKCLNRKLFAGGEIYLPSGQSKQLKPLKIAKYGHMGLQGESPVIFITFKGVNGTNYRQMAYEIRDLVAALYERHLYLRPKLYDRAQRYFDLYHTARVNERQLEDSLSILSILLCKHFEQRVYILIDEYDTPVSNLFFNLVRRYKSRFKNLSETEIFRKAFESKELEKALSLFRSILGKCFTKNRALYKGLMTGTMNVRLNDTLLGGLTDVLEYSLLEKRFSDFYGFSVEEVDDLLTGAGVRVKVDRQQMKDWYSGYNFGGKVVYNPWSVMRCLANDGKVANYWIPEANILQQVLLLDDMQVKLQSLACGYSVSEMISKQIPYNLTENTSLFSFLLYNGYLNPHSIFGLKRLAAPNREIRNVYKVNTLTWVRRKLNISVGRFASLAEQIASFRIDEFRESLVKLLSAIPTEQQPISENLKLFYNGIVLSMVYFLEKSYILRNYKRSDTGRTEVVLISKANTTYDNAILLKYQVSRAVKNLKYKAKLRLKCLNYTREDIDTTQFTYIKQVLKVSLIFADKDVGVRHEIQEISK